jgi:hypothetical protein
MVDVKVVMLGQVKVALMVDRLDTKLAVDMVEKLVGRLVL